MQVSLHSYSTSTGYHTTIKTVGFLARKFYKINQKNQSAAIGYWIHSDYTNRGFITAVVKKICAYSFYGLHLNKLSIFADVANVASNKVALKCGFEFVGTDKAEVLLRDELRDMNKYSLLKKDFQLE